MTSVWLYFNLHQPHRLKPYEPSEIDISHCYEDTATDAATINAKADNCYLPAFQFLEKLIEKNKGKFRFSFSISGIVLELLQKYRPDVIDSIRKITDTGCVELLAETYYNSLSSLYAPGEFRVQVEKHSVLVQELFGQEPAIFRNTGLIHNNAISRLVSDLGLKGLLCEGAPEILQGRSPDHLYASPDTGDFALLLRNKNISFSNPVDPLAASGAAKDNLTGWLQGIPENAEVLNLFIDFDTFLIRRVRDNGKPDFLEAMYEAILNNQRFEFSTPSETLKINHPVAIYNVPITIAGHQAAGNSCIWCENGMQNMMLKKIYSLEKMVVSSGNEEDADIWRRLQDAEYFFRITGRHPQDNILCGHPSAESIHQATQHYFNIVTDFEISLIRKKIHTNRQKSFVNSFSATLF
jgi:alpha-amylase